MDDRPFRFDLSAEVPAHEFGAVLTSELDLLVCVLCATRFLVDAIVRVVEEAVVDADETHHEPDTERDCDGKEDALNGRFHRGGLTSLKSGPYLRGVRFTGRMI